MKKSVELYALCDQETLDHKEFTLEKFVDIANSKDAKIIQYRNKTSDIAFIKSQIIKLRQLYDGIVIINDKYELAEYCDGVHIGQEDLTQFAADPKEAIAVLRSLVGSDKIIGLSTHNLDEIKIANSLNISYIGLGAYRETSTKDVDNILGDSLDELASHSKHPVAAIGGVKFSDTFDHVTYRVIGSAIYEY